MRRRQDIQAAEAKKAKKPSRVRRGLKQLGKVTLVVTFVGLLVGGWTYHGARAQITDGLMDLGGRMMVYAEARHQDAPRDLVINGQVLRFSSGTTPRSTQDVLDHFEARCAEVDGELMQQMTQLRTDHPEVDAEMPDRPALREDDGMRGYVTCLDMGQQAVPLEELVERIAAYGRTGDVSEIGDLRFVFAEQMGHGDERSTHFVAMWTTGSFDVRRMFPQEGDVPGEDVAGLDRPEFARRVLSGFERDQPQRLTVYETRDRDESDLHAFYRGALERDGWSLIENPDLPLDPRSPEVMVAENGQRMVTVVFHTNLQTGAASAAVFDGQ